MNRRDILKILGIASATPLLPDFLQAQRQTVGQSLSRGQAPAGAAPTDYTVVVIGSGFGGTMNALSIARALESRNKGEKMLILERGAWWTTPVGTVQDKEVKTADFLNRMRQPVRYWSSVENLMGLVDILLRCVRRPDHEDGLYDPTKFGRDIGKGSSQDDGVTVLRASGVGGGSLVYANVTIQPPRWIFEDERWPLSWDAKPGSLERGSLNDYYDTARDAIGYGVLFALQQRAHRHGSPDAAKESDKVNTGLSNIVTRSAPLQPHWKKRADPINPNSDRKIRYINLEKAGPDPLNHLWLDRARVFQTAMSQLTPDFGTVDSSINDINPETDVPGPVDRPARNYCERQGRCIVGCLPGARHTLNKQLQRAILGGPNLDDPTGPDTPSIFNRTYPLISLEALSEVNLISARPEGGYEIHYTQREPGDIQKVQEHRITAQRVIVAAGCIGTNLLLLRCKAGEAGAGAGTAGVGLPDLSDKLGFGFSTNGDYLAFMDNTRDRVSLTRGPITTSFGHFNTADQATGGDIRRFHTIEDNGIPRALTAVVDFGIDMLRAVTAGGGQERGFGLILRVIGAFLKKLRKDIGCLWKHPKHRPDILRSEDEVTARMMCVAAMGREASIGQFRLGTSDDETELRLSRTDGKKFYEDPIYDEIRATLARLAKALSIEGAPPGNFVNPFIDEIAGAVGGKSIGISHPLGGCRMARSVAAGVTDEYGRVFRKTPTSGASFYPGLYIADAALIPTALGVNPSLTISALALRVADKIIEELPAT